MILAHFWRPFGTLWVHFGALVGQIGTLLATFWARFWLFCTLGVTFWIVLGESHLLRPKSSKKHSCIDPGIKLLANFRMQTIFPRPGGGTIAAGNRDSPPGQRRPARGVLGLGHGSCFFPFGFFSCSRFYFAAGLVLQYSSFFF